MGLVCVENFGMGDRMAGERIQGRKEGQRRVAKTAPIVVGDFFQSKLRLEYTVEEVGEALATVRVYSPWSETTYRIQISHGEYLDMKKKAMGQ